jgi:hypothetical protein
MFDTTTADTLDSVFVAVAPVQPLIVIVAVEESEIGAPPSVGVTVAVLATCGAARHGTARHSTAQHDNPAGVFSARNTHRLCIAQATLSILTWVIHLVACRVMCSCVASVLV